MVTTTAAPVLGLLVLTVQPDLGRAGQALEAAQAAERAGHWESAEAILRPWVEPAADDYGIQLAYAYAALRAGKPELAEPAYRRAIASSQGAFEPRLGLADALAAESHPQDALPLLETLASERPFDAELGSRVEAVRRSLADGGARSWTLRVGATDSAELADGARLQTPDLGLALSVEASLARSWWLSATYRHLAPLGGTTAENEPSAGAVAAVEEEAFLQAGYRGDRWGVGLHLAYVSAASASSDGVTPWSASVAAGALSGSLTWGLVWTAIVSGSVYADGAVPQVELGATLPLPWQLFAYAGGRLQVFDSIAYPSAQAELRKEGGGWELAAGGAYGSQIRPVEWASSTVYDVPDTLLWRGFLRGALRLTDSLRFTAADEYERYAPAVPLTEPTQSGLFRLTVGITYGF